VSSHVEKIKEKLSIVDVLGSYITLEKAGANLKARCPFHNEKTASFFISPVRNTYYCFGCGAKGDIISFVQQFEGLDFMGALRLLAKQAGVELERENPAVRTERERLYLMLEYATLFFQKNLGSEAREYLLKRGLSEKTIKEWRLGYAPNDWKSLFTYLKTKNFKGEDIEKVGLIKKSEKVAGDFYDRFRGRIMFPIFDASGRVVAFSGRQFENDGTQAKYINSPETSLFEKSKILYGYDRAKLDIRKRDFSLLVEGQMDLLMSHQGGFRNAVASSGTALTTEQLEILRRLSNNIIIAYDGDIAGNAAARRGWELALRAGMEVKIASLPEGKDPADLILENQKGFSEALRHAQHIIDVELKRILTTEKDARMQGIKIGKEVLPLIVEIQSNIERSHFISKIGHEAGIKEDVLNQEIKKLENKTANTPSYTSETGSKDNNVKPQRKGTIERMLLSMIYWQEKQPSPVVNVLDIKNKFSTIVGTANFKELEATLGQHKDEMIFEAEIAYNNSKKLNELVTELLDNLKEEYLKEEFSRTMILLQQAEREKNNEKILELLRRCQEISLEIRNISQKK
jgi:DNA primase